MAPYPTTAHAATQPKVRATRTLLATLAALQRCAVEWLLAAKCAWLVVVFLDFDNILHTSSFYACMLALAAPHTWAVLAGSLSALSVAALSIPSSATVVRLVAREVALLGQVGLFSALAWLAACGRPVHSSIAVGDLMILAVFAFLAAAYLGLSFGREASRHRLRM